MLLITASLSDNAPACKPTLAQETLCQMYCTAAAAAAAAGK